MIGNAFFTSDGQNWFKCWYCQNVCDALSYRLENILIRFGTKLYKQIVEIALGTNCAPLIADFIMKGILWCLFLMIYKLIGLKLFTSGFRYLDDLLNNDNHSRFYYERDSMMSLSDDLQAYSFEAFYLRFQIFGRSFE